MDAKVSLSLDSSPFEAGLNKAEANARNFGGKLKSAIGGGGVSPWEEFIAGGNRVEHQAAGLSDRITGLFKRSGATGEIRAERALSGFIAQLTQGNIPGAIESITYRLTGLGLAAGVGIGGAIIMASKFSSEIRDVDKEVQKIQNDLARPIKFVAALGMEGIDKEIENTQKGLEDLAEKRKGLFQRFREAWQRGQRSSYEVGSDTSGASDRTPAAATAQAAEEKRLLELLSERANESERLAAIAERQLNTTKEGVKQEAIATEARKKRAEIELQFVDFSQRMNRERINAFSRDKLFDPKVIQSMESEAAESRRRSMSAVDRTEKAQLREQDVNAALRFKGIFEKSQLSFQELLGSPTEREGGSPRLARAKHLAEEAQHEEQLGAQDRGRGDIEGAFKHFLEAERIKSEIPQLSDKEKMPEYAFKSALGRTEELLLKIVNAFEGKEAISLANL